MKLHPAVPNIAVSFDLEACLASPVDYPMVYVARSGDKYRHAAFKYLIQSHITKVINHNAKVSHINLNLDTGLKWLSIDQRDVLHNNGYGMMFKSPHGVCFYPNTFNQTHLIELSWLATIFKTLNTEFHNADNLHKMGQVLGDQLLPESVMHSVFFDIVNDILRIAVGCSVPWQSTVHKCNTRMTIQWGWHRWTGREAFDVDFSNYELTFYLDHETRAILEKCFDSEILKNVVGV